MLVSCGDLQVQNMEVTHVNFGNQSGNYSGQQLREIGYLNAAVILVFMIVGIPWNLLVMAAILKKNILSQPSALLMFNLSVANLLLCLLHMPLPVTVGIGGYEDAEKFDGVCQAAGTVATMLITVVIYTVALMSVDRVI